MKLIPELPEDLKPRGEKPQFWLAVRPSTLAHLVGADEEDRDWDHYLERYLDAPSVIRAVDLCRALLNWLAYYEELSQYEALCKAVEVFRYGAEKYAPGNYRRAFADMPGMRREYASAIMRHMFQALLDDANDPESGLPHGAHALCGALMLLEGEIDNG